MGKVDCLVHIDKERLLGTPFITQRLGELNHRMRKGIDWGRQVATKIMKMWFVRCKVFMTVNTDGELEAYGLR